MSVASGLLKFVPYFTFSFCRRRDCRNVDGRFPADRTDQATVNTRPQTLLPHVQNDRGNDTCSCALAFSPRQRHSHVKLKPANFWPRTFFSPCASGWKSRFTLRFLFRLISRLVSVQWQSPKPLERRFESGKGQQTVLFLQYHKQLL